MGKKVESRALSEEFQDALALLLGQDGRDLLGAASDEDDKPEVNEALTFEEAGLTGGNRGVVVKLSDGAEVHISVAAYVPR